MALAVNEADLQTRLHGNGRMIAGAQVIAELLNSGSFADHLAIAK